MNHNWDTELEKEVESFVKAASKEEVDALLEKARVDHYNAIGAPLKGVYDVADESLLLGSAPVVEVLRESAAANAGPVSAEMPEPKSIFEAAWTQMQWHSISKVPFGASSPAAGKTEEMPLAA